MVIDLLRREHRNIERLLAVLEHELNLFDRAERPDYEVIRAIIGYFKVYPEVCHHPQEDKVFRKLKQRDPAAAHKVGDLGAEHRRLADGLQRVAHVVENVLADREILRTTVDKVIRQFIDDERRHILMEENSFFPAAIKALTRQDWAEIAAALSDQMDPLFDDVVEQRFEGLRRHILQLEREAESERG